LGDEDADEDQGAEPDGARPGSRLADAELLPREPVSDPQEEREDDQVRDQLADRDVVVVERVAGRLSRSEALGVPDRGEHAHEGAPGNELAVGHLKASRCKILATSTSAEPTFGPATVSLAWRTPKRPLRTAWRCFVRWLWRSEASVVPLSEVAR